MAIGAYTMAILIVKEGLATWLAAPLGGRRGGAAGILLGLPTLRLRADYFAIVTIAFGEIVRYVATNEDALTGGSQGTIASAGRPGGRVQRPVDALPELGAGPAASRSKDVAMLVIVWVVALVLLGARLARGADAVGARAASDPRGRGRGASLGKNVFAYKLQALALGAALAGVAGLFYAWQFSFFSPDDFQPLLTFFAWMIVILGGLGRVWAVPVGAASSGSSSPGRASSTSRRSRGSTRPTAPTCG